MLSVVSKGVSVGATLSGIAQTWMKITGTETVSSGGIASGTHIGNAGVLNLSGGSSVSAVISSGGIEVVFSGSVASNTTVLSGGRLIYAGGSTSGLKISAGGTETLAYGITLAHVTVSSGTTLIVSSGGKIAGATVLSGGVLVSAGGSITGAVFSAGGIASVLNTTVDNYKVGSGLELLLDTGAIAVDATVASGGNLTVKPTVSAAVTSGASIKGSAGGKASLELVSAGGTAIGTTVASSGTLQLRGGQAYGTIVSSGGVATVYSAGTTSGTTVSAAGLLTVSSGGTASATVLHGGAETVSSGGKIGGAVDFVGSGGKLTIGGTTGIAPTLSGFAKGDTLDLANIAFKGAKLSFVEKANTSGTLTITNGRLTATVTLFGQYVAGGFHLASDGKAGGTAITYTSAAAAIGDIAGHH